MSTGMHTFRPADEGHGPVDADRQSRELRRRILGLLERVHHELKTPLAEVLGLTEAVIGSASAEERADLAVEIQASARMLSGRLEETLSLLELEAGRNVAEDRCFSLPPILHNSFLAANQYLEGRENETEVINDSRIPLLLQGPSAQLERSLAHLLVLLSRQVEGGRTFLSAELAGESEDGVTVRFKVGIGDRGRTARPWISQRSIDLLFAKALVAGMGGELTGPQEDSSGYHLRFSLPLAVPAEEGPWVPVGSVTDAGDGEAEPWESPRGPLIEPLRILLAEDNPVMQRLTRVLLENRGHEVDAVNNGREAVEAVKVKAYDLVLMDLGMPEVDGISATKEIRLAAGGFGPPIIAFTAHDLAEVRKRCEDAGTDGFLAKPVDPETLMREVERWPRRSDG